jgi:hypothetical protein
MSAKLVGWALEQPNLTPMEKLLLVVLADHFNDQEGAAWPSQERIAKMMGLSTRQVRRIQIELINKGHLEVETRTGQSNLYRMTTPDMGVLYPGHTRPEGYDNGVLHNSYITLKERSVGHLKKTQIPDRYNPEPLSKDVLQGEDVTKIVTNIKKNLRKAQ